jgi:hypothetical protein
MDAFHDILDKFGTVTLSDVHDLIGLPSVHTDTLCGWTTKQTFDVLKTQAGYFLKLPEMERF